MIFNQKDVQVVLCAAVTIGMLATVRNVESCFRAVGNFRRNGAFLGLAADDIENVTENIRSRNQHQ
jgi:hypothetical protein